MFEIHTYINAIVHNSKIFQGFSKYLKQLNFNINDQRSKVILETHSM